MLKFKNNFISHCKPLRKHILWVIILFIASEFLIILSVLKIYKKFQKDPANSIKWLMKLHQEDFLDQESSIRANSVVIREEFNLSTTDSNVRLTTRNLTVIWNSIKNFSSECKKSKLHPSTESILLISRQIEKPEFGQVHQLLEKMGLCFQSFKMLIHGEIMYDYTVTP